MSKIFPIEIDSYSDKRFLFMQGICKLCHQEKELQLSHIIPKFCYSEMKNKQNRKEILELSEKMPLQKLQDGYKEYLLCRECEQKFSSNESYLGRAFKDFLWEEAMPICPSKSHIFDFNKYRKTHVKYDKFFLGMLSIYWRLSVSKKSNCQIELGPYLQAIEEMLINNNTIYDDKIKLQVCKLSLGDYDPKDLIFYRGKSRVSTSHVSHNLLLKGYYLGLILGNGHFDNEEFCLKRNGSLYIGKCGIENFRDFDRIKDLFIS